MCYGLMVAKLQLQTTWGQDPLLKLFVISNSDFEDSAPAFKGLQRQSPEC